MSNDTAAPTAPTAPRQLTLVGPSRRSAAEQQLLSLKNPLYRFALRFTAHQQEAEDLVQDTLLKVWQRREQWHEIESLEAFAMTVCRNLALDRLRLKDNRNASLSDFAHDHPDHSPDPLSLLQRKDYIDRIRRLMAAMPESHRTCMHLRDFEGMSYKEIATILGINEGQVKINIFRARKAVKEALTKED